MTGEQIVAKVKALGFPEKSYVVFGSCPLALAGIREANDVDMVVSPDLFKQLKLAGWKELHKNPDDIPLIYDVFEAHENWGFSSYSPSLKQLLATADIVDGVPFASLEEVRKWKAYGERPKDIADLALIDAYLSSR